MPQTEEILTIATYNIELGINEEKIIENIATMAKNGVAVFCLQEIVNHPDRTLIIDTILKNLGDDWLAASHLEDKTRKENIGSCILWNKKLLQFEKQQKLDLPKAKSLGLHEIVFAKLAAGATFPLQRRAITCTFLFANKKIQITSIHIDHINGTNHRIQQIKYFLANSPKNDYEIICGDFNTFDLLQTGKEKSLLQKTLGPEFVDASKKTGPTADLYDMHLSTGRMFKTLIKLFHIHIARKLDYIWVKNLQILDCDKQKMSGSDHLPIIARLSFTKS